MHQMTLGRRGLFCHIDNWVGKGSELETHPIEYKTFAPKILAVGTPIRLIVVQLLRTPVPLADFHDVPY